MEIQRVAYVSYKLVSLKSNDVQMSQHLILIVRMPYKLILVSFIMDALPSTSMLFVQSPMAMEEWHRMQV